ncbi:MAG: hypothetical protein ACK5NC_01090 [Vibrio sp.]
MSAVFIALALVSGFIFTQLHIPARYRQKRTTGWDSYFYVATKGALLGLSAAIFCIIFDYYNIVAVVLNKLGFEFKNFDSLSITIEDIKVGAWSVTSIILAYISGGISKLVYRSSDKRNRAITKTLACDYMDTFWIRAMVEIRPVLVTLKSRKCYVGLALGDVGAMEDGCNSLLILPLLSGYRDKDDLSLEINTNYYKHYLENEIGENSPNLNLSHFQNVLPKSEVESLSFFDIDTFRAFKKEERQKKAKRELPN